MIFDIKNWLWKYNFGTFQWCRIRSVYKMQHFPWSPFIFFDKIKLILDPPGLNKRTKLILTHMPDESTVCCTLVLNGSGTYFSKEKHWPPRTWSFKFLSFGDKQGSTNRKKSSESFSATSAVSKDTKDKVNPCALS